MKRIALALATGLAVLWTTVCSAQVYIQQSYGANSQNVIKIFETQTLSVQKLQPEIYRIIHTLEKEKSKRLRQIGDDFKKGNSDEALVHIHDALIETRNDAARLAFLHYAAGHALLLSGMYTSAAKQADLAVGLSPENCRYRTSGAMILIAAGRPWDAEAMVGVYNEAAQHCEASGSEIDRALIHAVRAFVAANRRDEPGTKNEMNAADAILAKMRPSDGIDDRYYEFQLNCTFAANAHQYWKSADQLWPDATGRCERWGKALNTTMPGARELARYAANADLINEGAPDQVHAILSERIRDWSNRQAIPELGFDNAGRLASLGSLYLARGMVNLWQLKKPAAAADDYRQAYNFLTLAAATGRPSAVADLANLGFKIRHLEELSNEKVFPDSKAVLATTIEQIADSSLTGDGSEACNALYWIAGLARELESHATARLQQKRSECEVSLQRDSIQQLTFTAMVAEQDIDYFTKQRDDAKVVSQLDVAIASRMKLRGFPKTNGNESTLSRELVARARYTLQGNDPQRSLYDANLAVDVAGASENPGVMVGALNIKAYILGASGDNATEALSLISHAKQIAFAEYTKPTISNVSCFNLYQYTDVFATESEVQIHAREWKSAEAAITDLLKVLSAQKTCGDLRFDGKSDEQEMTPVKMLLMIRTVDAGTSLDAIQLLDADNEESRGKAKAFLEAKRKSLVEMGFRDMAWPITSFLTSAVSVH
jgi:hypothetical protein